MKKRNISDVLTLGPRWIFVFLLLILFQLNVYIHADTESSNAQHHMEVAPADGQNQADPSPVEVPVEIVPEINPIASSQPVLVGNPLPDQATQDNLQAVLSSPYMPIDILVGDQYLLTTTDAFSFYGIIYVPLRSIFNLIPNTTIDWQQESLQANVTLPLDNTTLHLSFFANSTVYLNDGIISQLPAASLQKDGSMIIPLSFVVDLLGMSMQYDNLYHEVRLNTDKIQINPLALGNRFYTPAEVRDFSRLIYKEAGSTSYSAIHGVASVVLNHIRHPYYPNTLSGVIYALAPSGAPHYTPAHKSGFTSVIPNYNSILAAKRVLRGENSIGPAIYFNTRPFKNKTIFAVIDGIYFCY